MSSYTGAILMFALVIISVMLGHPVAFTIGGLSAWFGLLWWGGGFNIADVLAKNVFGTVDNYIYAAIPMFVFMGAILEKSGLGEVMYEALHRVMGNLRGGLALVTILICTLFAASTGIIATGIVVMGLLALPQMLDRRYDKRLAAGSVMAGGTLGILIPPSIMLVVIGSLANLSVGKLFMGALLPGFLMSLLYIIFVTGICYLKPNMGPGYQGKEKLKLFEKFKIVFTSVVPAIALILAVLGSIFFGLASPTEASSLGAVGSVIIAACYKKLKWTTVKEACIESMLSYGMIIWLLTTASCYASVFLGAGGGEAIARFLLGLGLGRTGILVVIMLVIFLLGMIMEWIAIIILCVPIFFPIVISLGYDPLWFAILISVCMQTAFLTPPYGTALFILKGIAPKEVTSADLWQGAWFFIPLQLLTLCACMLFPNIILYLPKLMIK